MDNTEINHEQEQEKQTNTMRYDTIRLMSKSNRLDSTRLDRHPGQPLLNLIQPSGVASVFSGDILYRTFSDSYGYGVHNEYALMWALHSKQYEKYDRNKNSS